MSDKNIKNYENMSVEELIAEVSKTHKKTNFKPQKANTDENGTILLNPNKKNDKEWYENDGDYDVL